jgi:hypothetical protein
MDMFKKIKVLNEYKGRWFCINTIEGEKDHLVKRDRIYKLENVEILNGIIRVNVRKRYGHYQTFFQMDRFFHDFIEIWQDETETIIFKLRFNL